MAVRRRTDTGKWVYRTVVKLPSGKTKRIFGTPTINTKAKAEEAERDHVARTEKPPKPDAPLFSAWFNGRFWSEWVIARKNKPSEIESKRSVYRNHLELAFADMPLDEIGVAEVARFRGKLISEVDKHGEPVRGEKTVNNILGVLSKALHYAADVDVIAKAPRVGIYKVERPEIEAWEIEEYAALAAAARAYKVEWWLAFCLAGEAGLRVGEVKAMKWDRIDFRARTITVAEQIRHGVTGTPKGGTRRTVPMTEALYGALHTHRAKSGYVVRDSDIGPVSDNSAEWAITAICGRAGLPTRKWHTLRHSFGTHAALLGVNPWRLMSWMGHKRIDETMRYVHVAETHARQVSVAILEAAGAEPNPDRRILLQLGARGTYVALTPSRKKKSK